MAIPSGVIVGWPSTAASIPSGWTRETTLDARFTKGTAAAVDPAVNGGSATHVHTSPTHTHSVGSHTHTGAVSGAPNYSVGIDGTAGNSISLDTHGHTSPTTGADTGTSGTNGSSWGSTSSDPANYVVIWIKSDGTPVGIPANAVAFWNNATLPPSWTQPVSGKNAFLKGAAAAGDGGGTGGGGSHTHTDTAHLHTVGSHAAHTSGTSGGPSVTDISGSGGNSASNTTHTHSTSISASAANTGSTASAATAGTTHEPEWYKLVIVSNGTGADSAPTNIIAGWLGTLASIPAGWVLCDGTLGTPDLRGKFIKGVDATSEIGNTGGTAGHDHTDPAGHTHTTAHTHPVNFTISSGDGVNITGIIQDGAGSAHTHSTGTSGSGGPTSGSTVKTVDTTADTQPAFRTVAYIQLQEAQFMFPSRQYQVRSR